MSALPSTSAACSQSSTCKACTDAGASNLQIFLGGSCNPTTWRQNVAIPFLETNGISYYNPQVDDWTPEIVDLERWAKQNAQLLLFVIDRQTRSTVSLVESAFIAGDGKNLVVVIYPLEYNVICLKDTTKETSNLTKTISRHTSTSLYINKDQAELSSFAKSSSTLTTCSTLISSSTTNDAKLSSKTLLTSSKTTTNSSSTDLNSAIQSDERKVNQNMKKTHEKAKKASSSIRINDETISSSELQELKLARYILKTLIVVQNIPMFSDILQALNYISCSLNENTEKKDKLRSGRKSRGSSENEDTVTKFIFPLEPNQVTQIRDDVSKDTLKDIYLSLDSDDHNIIESSVIPILEESGLTYDYRFINNITKLRNNSVSSSPSVNILKLAVTSQSAITVRNELAMCGSNFSDTCETTKFAVEQEISVIKSSRVLLFVITNRCRGLSIMVLASHFMALFKNNVVLCVQYLEEPCSIGGETLTKSAIADYNRGRVYLCDYAVKSQVPVFSTVREAIECCSRKCRYK